VENHLNPEILKFMVRVCLVYILSLVIGGCALHHPTRSSADYGIRSCPAGAGAHLLSTDALQCWFTAPNGRWRTLSHESHYAVLVVNVEAADIGDAVLIARRFVARERDRFSEILVYVQQPSTQTGTIRRIRWTTEGGFETLDFRASPTAALRV
jgi:hypothetical protein